MIDDYGHRKDDDEQSRRRRPLQIFGENERRRRHLPLHSDLGDRNLLETVHSSQKPNGDESCPCLSAESLVALPIEEDLAGARDVLGEKVDLSLYGIGCAPHDVDATACAGIDECATSTPLPLGCGRSWCQRPWCFVDPDDCALLNRPSELFRGDDGAPRHYSYATCGFMDSFTYTERLNSLKNKTLKVAFNSNTGGWKGAYNPGGSFDLREDMWTGPVVNFVRRAAIEGGFEMDVVSPPEWLKNQSERFFGSSSFDRCVHSAALGYVDLCVAAYTITDKRASVTTFFETADDPIYLITFDEDDSSFWTSFLTVFRPFTLGSWLMIFAFSLPLLGLLMFYHEYGVPGSAFPKTSPIMVQDVATDRTTFENRRIPMWKHTVTSAYMGWLAFFQESYNQSVVSWGGKINLLAISSFVLLVLNVYTANLAAILTDDIVQGSVSSMEDAVKAGYTFCSERKVAQSVIKLYNIDPSLVIPDPVDIGGDGEPGFNCPKCNARVRVFEYMRQTVDEGSSLYCHAAFASWEDLQVLQSSGEQCDKTRVGEMLLKKATGIPMFQRVSPGLTALFYQIKNDGVMAKELIAAEPINVCPPKEEESSSLSIQDLTGIWMFSFSFAVAGLVAKFVQGCSRRREAKATSGTRVRALQRYDHWGNPTSHDIIIDGQLVDPDDVRQIYEMNSSSVMTEEHPFAKEVSQSEESDVCTRVSSIARGTFEKRPNAQKRSVVASWLWPEQTD